MYQKTVQVIPIFTGERILVNKAKIINAQYVKMLVMVSLDFIDMVDQLSVKFVKPSRCNYRQVGKI